MSACRLHRDAEGQVTACISLTHAHQDHNPTLPITAVLCCTCSLWTAVDDLFVDTDGQKWDYCKECEHR